MAKVDRSALNQFYYNEGMEFRRNSSNVDEINRVKSQLAISEGEDARIAFEYGILDESIRQSMTAFGDGLIQMEPDALEIAMVLIQISTNFTETLVAMTKRRLFGL